MTDYEAWVEHPEYRWMFDRLALAERLGYKCGPHGVWPDEFPVISKPIINLYGMGIGAEVFENDDAFPYRAGHFWCELFEGEWRSYDIDLTSDYCYEAIVVDSEDRYCPTVWEITQQRTPGWLWPQVLPGLKKKPNRMNVETIGQRVIEMHPRWTEEFEPYYDGRPFTCEVMWWPSIDDPPLEGFTDTRLCDSNVLRLAEGKAARIGIRIARC